MPKKTVILELCQRSDWPSNPMGTPHYHICVQGNTGLWDCGSTPDNAVDAFLRTHQAYADHELDVRYLPGVRR
jgi:hypothetical protein